MTVSIRKAAVLGAGIMGSGIAAHLANAGIPTILLDIVPPKAKEGEDTSSKAFRNKFAAGGLAKLKKAKAAGSPLFCGAAADFIEVGNFDDDLHRVSECDWVVEVIIENLDIKRGLFAKLEEHVGPNTIVSSNTSGLRIADMLEGRSDQFRKNFLVTHFFNPVRYMRLLELVAGEETDPAVVQTLHKFGEESLGKGIVYGKDTVNFVANRIGVYGMMKTLLEMQAAELSVQEVDAIMGPAMGRPKSAVFRTADLVGIDTFAHVAQNCYDSLLDDEERDVFQLPGFLAKMVEKKMLGDKTRGGFYKKTKDEAGKRVIMSVDIDTLEYSPSSKPRFKSVGAARKVKGGKPAKIAALMRGDDKAAKFAEKVTLATLAYASRRIPEITDDIVNLDRGLRWGFNWDYGPFETWDAYGVQAGVDRMKELDIAPAPWVQAMLDAGQTSFYGVDGLSDTYWNISETATSAIPTNPRALSIATLRRGEKLIEKNTGASLWDMGDGVALLEFHTKMNAIDMDIATMLEKSLDTVERDFKGMVIGNEASNFSVGANIGMIMMAAGSKAFDQIETMIATLQSNLQRVYYSRVPVVTAPAGMTFGGGCEFAMAGNATQAAAETYIGLVEVGVGLIPGAGGNMMLLRNLYGAYAADRDFDSFPFVKKAFLTIGTGKVCFSAEEAKEVGFLRWSDGISYNRDFLLNDAKAKVIGLADSGFVPPRPTKFLLSGPSGKATIDMMLYDMELNGQISAHDRLIGAKLATVLTGGNTSATSPVTEERLLELEREAFVSLCGEPKTMERIGHMLTTGKPLRN